MSPPLPLLVLDSLYDDVLKQNLFRSTCGAAITRFDVGFFILVVGPFRYEQLCPY